MSNQAKYRGGVNSLKTKMPLTRSPRHQMLRHEYKILRHEPLEERQMLAVGGDFGCFGELGDFGNVSIGASEANFVVFPQPRYYYETAQTSRFAQSDIANCEESALVPTGIFAAEVSVEIAAKTSTETAAKISEETVTSSRSLVTVRVLEKYLQERLCHTEFAGLQSNSTTHSLTPSILTPPPSTTSSMAVYPCVYSFELECNSYPLYDYVYIKPGNSSPSNELIILQDGNTATIKCTMFADDDPSLQTKIIVTNDTDNAWSHKTPTTLTGGCEYVYTWKLPTGMTNADAQRDFTFEAVVYDSTGDLDHKTLYVHVGYAGIAIEFAGENGFKERSTVGGQTASNTVVVGQKVEAKIKTIGKVSVDMNTLRWSSPWGGDVVHNYITGPNEGRIEYLDDV